MNHLQAIDQGAKVGVPYHEIARKVFLTYPTQVFVGAEEQQYEILNEISEFFSIPIMCIHVVGSAKTGKSFHKSQDFIPGSSDLDVGIIDSSLFIKHMELVFTQSKGYFDRTSFPMRNGVSSFQDYISYLSRGIFRPDLMPVGPERARWNDFFGRLSGKHNKLFRSISAAIYLSQNFFEQKQRSAIKNYLQNRPIL
ncbi:MAG: hypothetical protein HOP19_06730 [Acidobacteria bacterium]|nr:hypothetical protein [Acidobacteriota bacterium]